MFIVRLNNDTVYLITYLLIKLGIPEFNVFTGYLNKVNN